MFLTANQLLLTTLVVKITIVAALATILVRYTPVTLLPQVAALTLDTPADVGGPPLFLLHAALLI